MTSATMNETTVSAGQFAATPEELKQWDELGYIIREGVFSPEECDELVERAAHLASDEGGMPARRVAQNALSAEQKQQEPNAAPVMHAVRRPHIYDAQFRTQARDPRITDVVASLIGPDLATLNTLFIFKAPGVGLPFPWHQDMFFFQKRFETPTTCGTWQAMDDATTENGCMWVVPGSHKMPILEHDLPGDGPQQEEFRKARVPTEDDARAIPVEIPKGSVLFFHGYLLHKSGHNHSTKYRRTYVAHYVSGQAKDLNTGSEPLMLVRGQVHPNGLQPEPDATLREADLNFINRPQKSAAAMS